MEYNLGRVVIVPRGAFVLGTPYKALDMVSDASSGSYLAKRDSTGVPLTDTNAWMKVASNGAAGATGVQGSQGVAGTQGPRGADGAPGMPATITIGSVTSVDADTPATVFNRGTASAAVLDFSIPCGRDGDGMGDMLQAYYDNNGDGIVNRADYADAADHALEADRAFNADYAVHADRASEADRALQVDHADEADRALEADRANTADNADNLGGLPPEKYAKMPKANCFIIPEHDWWENNDHYEAILTPPSWFPVPDDSGETLIDVGPDPMSVVEWCRCGVRCTEGGGGSLTFVADSQPRTNLNVNLMIMEVTSSD